MASPSYCSYPAGVAGGAAGGYDPAEPAIKKIKIKQPVLKYVSTREIPGDALDQHKT